MTQLQRYREERKISIEKLASESGIPKHLIEEYENNNYWTANYEEITKIVRALGLRFILIESDT